MPETTTQLDVALLRQAITHATRCTPVVSAFNVGAILTTETGVVLSHGFSRELEGNTHAEEVCLLKLTPAELAAARGGTMYTTMEPCGLRLSGKKCCAERILDAGIARVVMGQREPETFVGVSKGMLMLRDQGIVVVAIPELESEIATLNSHLS